MIIKEYRTAHRSEYLKSILFTIFLTFFLFAVFLGTQGHCSQVTLTWDPNNEPDLAGYEIYYGTASGNYQSNIDVGNVTTYTVNSLTTGVTYYFAATAYNTSGLESGYSNEVVYTPPACTYSISPSSASFSASGGTGSVLVTTQAGCNWVTSAAPSWVTVNNGSGTGTGTMNYTISTNTGTTRIASLTIAGNIFTITETGLAAYTITASAATGGVISPSGAVSVQPGANQIFSITPNSGYVISGVLVDGVSQGAITSYTFSGVTTNHTIAASFTPVTYTLSITKNGTGGGTVTSNPTGTSFSAGTPVTLTAAPDTNSVFSSWSGGCSGTATTCLVTMNSNMSVTATFTLKTYTLTASAGTGGTISPSGAVSAQSGASQLFTITPNSGYGISSVLVDGVSQGAITSYTFSGVITNHTIAASFTPVTYTLSITKNGTGGGTVTSNPTGTSFSAGTPVTLTAAPDANSVFSGWSGACTGTATTCLVTMSANKSVTATFTLKTYTITASAGTGGTISPSGAVSAQSGASQLFTITPNSGYVISSVLVDGVSQGAIATYTFSAVSTNHTIAATFYSITATTYTITATAGANGSITPSGSISVGSGASQTFTITPNSGYSVLGVTVDGASVGAVTTYAFTNVTANHTIAATFTTITATSGSPIVSTGSATLVPLSSSATLNGTVNPNSLTTTYVFQWGRTTAYGNTTAVTSAGSGTGNIAASAGITGLRSYTVYYYRLVATNSAGTTYGANKSFKTKFTGIRK